MTNEYYVRYSDEAKDDLRNIFMYITYKLHARDNAEAQVNRIRTAIHLSFSLSAVLVNKPLDFFTDAITLIIMHIVSAV